MTEKSPTKMTVKRPTNTCKETYQMTVKRPINSCKETYKMTVKRPTKTTQKRRNNCLFAEKRRNKCLFAEKRVCSLQSEQTSVCSRQSEETSQQMTVTRRTGAALEAIRNAPKLRRRAGVTYYFADSKITKYEPDRNDRMGSRIRYQQVGSRCLGVSRYISLSLFEHIGLFCHQVPASR